MVLLKATKSFCLQWQIQGGARGAAPLIIRPN